MPPATQPLGRPKVRTLRPVPTPSHEALEAALLRHLRAHVYLPLVKALGEAPRAVLNEKGGLFWAIGQGRVTYRDGAFRGTFDAATSRELKGLGAEWRDGAWHLPPERLPADVHAALRDARAHFERQAKAVDEKLQDVSPEQVAESLRLDIVYGRVADKVETGLSETMRIVSVKPELSAAARERIAAEYTENMRRYIADFTAKEIKRLREEIKANTLSGGRREQMIKAIQTSYGVTQRKAKFLARQETSLFTASLKKTRYIESGVTEYKWRCVVGSSEHPVRPMHRALSDASDRGKLFRFDDPPVTNEEGQRNSPGEDFNCRCHAIPVVRF